MAKDKNLPDKVNEPKITASVTSILNKDSEEAGDVQSVKNHRVDINWDKVETAMALGADLKMCAMFGGCHWNTLERRVLERYGDGFREVRSAFMTDRKAMALKQLWNLVSKGNVRATLFVNRAINGLNDRPKDNDDDESGESSTFRLAYNLDDEPPTYEADFSVQGDVE